MSKETADIFVEPTLPEEDNDPRWLIGGYEIFKNALDKRMHDSALPILIGYRDRHPSPYQNAFAEHYRKQLLQGGTYLGGINDYGDQTSFLFGADLRRAIKSIKEKGIEDVRVHGCYFGYGLVYTAGQFAVALSQDKYLFDSIESMNDSGKTYDKLVRQKAFTNSCVKIGEGLVYPDDNYRISQDPETGLLTTSTVLAYQAEAQFCDEDTKLHYLGD